MAVFLQRTSLQHLRTHKTKQHVLRKFLLVVAIVLGYFLFVAYHYGLEQGLIVTALTWSFFVLCTPVADAGFLIDFPLRVITCIRMVYSEIVVWAVAISLNVYALVLHTEWYERTDLLQIFKHILTDPWPFWGIILISGIGTFVSVLFGDELLSKTHHHERTLYHKNKHRYRLLVFIFIFLATFLLYGILVRQLQLDTVL